MKINSFVEDTFGNGIEVISVSDGEQWIQGRYCSGDLYGETDWFHISTVSEACTCADCLADKAEDAGVSFYNDVYDDIYDVMADSLRDLVVERMAEDGLREDDQASLIDYLLEHGWTVEDIEERISS